MGKPGAIYRMVPLSITLIDPWLGFQGRDIFQHWISQKRREIRDIVTIERLLIGSHTCFIEWWHFQWPWRTPNPVIKVTAFLKSNISKTVCFTDLL